MQLRFVKAVREVAVVVAVRFAKIYTFLVLQII